MRVQPDYFAILLKCIMSQRGFTTQKQLADFFGVTPTMVNRWLQPSGVNDTPSQKHIELISKEMDISINNLMLRRALLSLAEQGIDISELSRSPQLTQDEDMLLTMFRSGDYVGLVKFVMLHAIEKAKTDHP